MTKQKEILEEVKHFNKTLYKNQQNKQDNKIQMLLQSLSQRPKLSAVETNLLNGELTEQDLVVQSIVSLTSSLRDQLVKCFTTL